MLHYFINIFFTHVPPGNSNRNGTFHIINNIKKLILKIFLKSLSYTYFFLLAFTFLFFYYIFLQTNGTILFTLKLIMNTYFILYLINTSDVRTITPKTPNTSTDQHNLR